MVADERVHHNDSVVAAVQFPCVTGLDVIASIYFVASLRVPFMARPVPISRCFVIGESQSGAGSII